MIYFEIISGIGEARSSYIETVQKAKQGDFENARECVRAGQEMFLAGYETHFKLIQKEVRGEQVGGPMILVHAEDQLMSAGGSKIITGEMLASYERIAELEKRLENQ